MKPAWHLFPIRVDAAMLNVDRGRMLRALRSENIGVNVHYIPVHLQPYYRHRFGFRGGEYPAAECAYQQLISLPMFHAMNDQDVDDVVSAVSKVTAHYSARRYEGSKQQDIPRIDKQVSQVYMSAFPGMVRKIPWVEPEPERSEMKMVRKG